MPIPDRAPVGDRISGHIYQFEAQAVLSPAPLASGEKLASGEFVVRYAVPYLGKPHFSIVPGLIALDYGDMLTGEEAWEFLLRRSNLHPRADVIGYRNDGADEMIVIKWLDLAQPIQVLAYADDSAIKPMVQLQALIGFADSALPPRLAQYLPHYSTITDWQAATYE